MRSLISAPVCALVTAFLAALSLTGVVVAPGAGVLAGAGQAAEGGCQPTWYSGHSWHSHGVSGFGDNLGSSLSSALNTSSTAPGSSGGGGSGGGGGGGGGGGF